MNRTPLALSAGLATIATGAGGSRRPGAAGALITGGVLWVTAALVGGEDGTARFYVAEVVWLLAQLALLAGTLLLWKARPHGERRLGGAGFALASAGRVVFVAAEALALATGKTAEELLPLAALLTAVGLVLAGVAVARERRWTGWATFAPLAVGVFPFLAMFPFAASDADGPPVVSMVVWGLAFAALGLAASEQAGRIARAGPARAATAFAAPMDRPPTMS